MLRSVFGQRGALDVSHVRDGDHHLVVGVEVFRIELFGAHHDLGAAFVAVLLLDLQHLLLHDAQTHLAAGEHAVVVFDPFEQLGVLLFELAALQAGQCPEAHVDDGLCLHFAQAEALHEGRLGHVGRLRTADDGDDLVDMVEGDEQTAEDVGPFLGLVEVVARAALHDVVPVVHEVADEVLQVEQHGTSVHQRDVVHREAGLQLRVFEEGVEHHARHGVALEDDDDARTAAVAFVIDVRDAVDLLLVDHVGNLADHLRFVHLVGNLRHDDALAAAVGVLDLGAGPHDDASAARFERFAHAFVAVYDAARGEVGSFHVVEQLGNLDLRIVDVGRYRVAYLRKVVGRHVGGHTHCDARRAVYQQQRDAGGQYGGFLEGVVEVVDELHRILADVGHDLVGDLAHAGLGVTHGGGAVAVHRAEVTLSVHQRVAHGPRLRHTYHGEVDGAVAVGVELTQHVAHDTGALAVGLVRIEVQFVAHIEEDAPVHGLQAVAHVGQRTGYDDRHRIVDVGGLHLLLYVDPDDPGFGRGFFSLF